MNLPSTNSHPATVKPPVSDVNGNAYISAALTTEQKFMTETFLFLTILRLNSQPKADLEPFYKTLNLGRFLLTNSVMAKNTTYLILKTDI